MNKAHELYTPIREIHFDQFTGDYSMLLKNGPAVKVEKTQLVNAKVSAAWEGLKILYLTDSHLKNNQQAWLHEIIARLNQAEEIDLVCLGGDFFSEKNPLSPTILAQELSRLKQKYGIFAVYGNHDVFVDGGTGKLDHSRAKALKTALETQKIKLLIDEEVTLTNLQDPQEKLVISGLRDLWQSSASEQKLETDFLKRISQENPRIFHLLLSHQPLFARDHQELIASGVVDLILSGHTHGGSPIPEVAWQMLTRVGAGKVGVANWDSRYTLGGLYQIGTANLIISTGLDSSDIHLISGEQPTVEVITLVSHGREKTWEETLASWNWANQLKKILLGNRPPKWRAGQKPTKKRAI